MKIKKAIKVKAKAKLKLNKTMKYKPPLAISEAYVAISIVVGAWLCYIFIQSLWIEKKKKIDGKYFKLSRKVS